MRRYTGVGALCANTSLHLSRRQKSLERASGKIPRDNELYWEQRSKRSTANTAANPLHFDSSYVQWYT
jgi:hypothetical protein